MNTKHKYTNLLINETSPYLLQHAHNPVDWYPWGDEAFEKAKREDKLVLVSIGYAACHWCHVMEHESFEDEEVAGIMNEHFVCIKVDREERPDVDHTYMDAVQIMTGHGGWPLNCFTLPDGRPIFGGTYFRKEHWMSVLTQLKDVYEKDRPRVIRSAEELMKGINKYNIVNVNTDDSHFDAALLKTAIQNWKPGFDKKDGGNQGAPKFPMPSNYLFLLKYFYYNGDDEVLKHLELSLDKMASGGIYDQLGGGFARYSTDALWMVPHFEKMLYDNAQLIDVYAKAWKLFQKDTYKKVVFESIGFIDRELTSPEGTFYSAIDADSEGEEGTFYIWQKSEVDDLLGKDAPVFNAYFGITETGNWEHGNNVLHQHKSLEEIAQQFEISEDEAGEILNRSKRTLFETRSKRERPITDDKVLTSWNALTISGLVEAYRSFGEEAFLSRALKAATYLQAHCVTKEGQVFRMVRANSNIPGFLDDYSLLAQAFIDLYRVTFDEQWLLHAQTIVEFTIDHFYQEETGMFYYADPDEGGTITNKTEVSDNVIPSSNSIMAKVLYQLSYYFEQSDYFEKADKMLNNVLPQLETHPNYHSNWAGLLCDFVFQPPEMVFTGKEAEQLRKEFDSMYLYALVAGSVDGSDMPLLKNRVIEGESFIYVCHDRVCKLPVKTLKEAIEQM